MWFLICIVLNIYIVDKILIMFFKKEKQFWVDFKVLCLLKSK